MSSRPALPATVTLRLAKALTGLVALVGLVSCTETRLPSNEIELFMLDGGWTVHSPDTLGSYPAEVPGTVHTDLLAAGIIADPFAGHAEAGMHWISEQVWEYTCSFNISTSQLGAIYAELVFEGLDTYAVVWLNGQKVLQADNMFRTWRVPVKGLLRQGENVMRVQFDAPLLRHANTTDALGLTYPADNDPSRIAPFVRKAAYHFGWDWAPRFVGCGIWQPVYIAFQPAAAIRGLRVQQVALSDSLAVLRCAVQVEAFTSGLSANIAMPGADWFGTLPLGLSEQWIDFELKNPKQWWPNGEGEAYLYDAQVWLVLGKDTVQHLNQKYGLRSVELINVADSIGTSFYFQINGKSVFAKGANYVPQDVFLPRVQSSQYRHLLVAAKEANMNMLRVWGGGVYERELFYGLCDSLGIMVWQDFMFAGSMFPFDSAFAANVEAEARQQLARIGKHPCLVLWCGNNEVEVAWNNWGWQEKYGYSSADSAALWRDYKALFHELLPGLVAEVSPDIPYVSTTPQSNWGSPDNFNHGSMHYWGVWHGRAPIASFSENVGRFMVEYGMQSYPAAATLAPYLDSAGMQLGSAALGARQRSYIGDGEIWRLLNEMGEEPGTYAEFAEASQRLQAAALRLAITAHLEAEGHCMGSLLWQLNDCWPGPSWSIIDFAGRRKLAYTAVQEGFAR
jgi:beta-mannosidase